MVFVCTNCKREFRIRIGVSHMTDIHAERNLDEQPRDERYGSIVVVENKFAYKQVLPLQLGDNEIGRYLKGTAINQPIETSDPSIDTFHCVIHVEHDRWGNIRHTLRDAPSTTGKFHQNRLLKDVDRIRLTDGDIITIGATTLIFRSVQAG